MIEVPALSQPPPFSRTENGGGVYDHGNGGNYYYELPIPPVSVLETGGCPQDRGATSAGCPHGETGHGLPGRTNGRNGTKFQLESFIL
jgi:hypothetical protein